MARYTGRTLEITWTPDGGSAVTLNTDFRSFQPSYEVDTIDASAGNDAHRQYLAGLKDGTVSLELLDDDANTASFRSALAVGTTGTLEWRPQGTGSGKPAFSAPAMVTSAEFDYPYDDVVTISVEFQLNDEVTETTQV